MITMTADHTVDKCIKQNKHKLKPKLEKIHNLIDKGMPFSIYVMYRNKARITSFYPVLHNIIKEPVAWIVSYTHDIILEQTIRNSIIISSLSFTGLLSLFSFLYFLFLQKDFLRSIVDKKSRNL